ncbi:MAG: YdcF family protein [Thiomonas sp.]
MKHSLELLLSPVGITCCGLIALTVLVSVRPQRLALRVLVYATTLVFLLASMPLTANLALGALERQARAAKVCPAPPPGSVLVVLAGGVNGNPTNPDDVTALKASSLRRTLSAVQLAQQVPASMLLISGGWGKTVREADLMGTLARQMGFPAARIELDARSRTTYQSAVNLRARLLRIPARQRYLITSADHMPRAMMAFAHEGLTMCAWPVDDEALPLHPLEMLTPQLSALEKSTRVLHELLGMLYYRLVKFQ